MRLGTIAQHANVGSGRINDHSIWLHHDYTNTGSLTTTTSDLSSGSLRILSCSDNGPHNAPSFVDTSLKSPFIRNTNTQNNLHSALSYETKDNDYGLNLKFTNPTEELSMRNFTATYVFDYHVANEAHDAVPPTTFGSTSQPNQHDQTYLKLTGASGESGIAQYFAIELDVDALWYGVLIHTYRAIVVSNDGTNSILKNVQTGDICDYDQTWLRAGAGGDHNWKFNWITVVGNTDGSADMYIRGVKVASLSAGNFPDETIKPGAVSFVMNDGFTGGNAANLKTYEYMIFNKALTTQQLYDIDWYIAEKYNYRKGRAYGLSGCGD